MVPGKTSSSHLAGRNPELTECGDQGSPISHVHRASPDCPQTPCSRRWLPLSIYRDRNLPPSIRHSKWKLQTMAESPCLSCPAPSLHLQTTLPVCTWMTFQSSTWDLRLSSARAPGSLSPTLHCSCPRCSHSDLPSALGEHALHPECSPSLSNALRGCWWMGAGHEAATFGQAGAER